MIPAINSKDFGEFLQRISGQTGSSIELSKSILFAEDSFSVSLTHSRFPREEIEVIFNQDLREINLFNKLHVIINKPEVPFDKFHLDQNLAEAIYKLSLALHKDVFSENRPFVSLLDMKELLLTNLMEWRAVLIPTGDYREISTMVEGPNRRTIPIGEVISENPPAYVESLDKYRYWLKFTEPRKNRSIEAAKLHRIMMPKGSQVLVWDSESGARGIGTVESEPVFNHHEYLDWVDHPGYEIKINKKIHKIKYPQAILGILRWGPHEMPKSTQGLVI